MSVTLHSQAASFGKVAVLMGGISAEREISLMSGSGVLQALQSRGVDAHAFDPRDHDLSQLKTQGYARCFIALHGRFGEDGTVQGALELLGIPYTGSGVLSSSLAMDKIMTKRIWRAEGLSTPDWRLVRSAAQTLQAFDELTRDLPAEQQTLIVKPAREGSTLGLTKVTHRDQCLAAYELAAQKDDLVLAEQFIAGEEVTCPVLRTEAGQVHAMPLIRIQAPQGNYDYQNKYFTDEVTYLCPSGLPAQEEQVIREMVVAAFETLNCRSCARADVMIDARTRKPYLLEINTNPGMTSHSLVPMAARAVGWDFAELCLQILSTARLDHHLPQAVSEQHA